MIGDKIRRLRKANGLNQKQLAEKATLSQALVSRLENGAVAELKSNALARLAKALRVSADFLIGGSAPDLVIRREEPLTAAELAAAIELVTPGEFESGGVILTVASFRQGRDYVAFVDAKRIRPHDMSGPEIEAMLADAFSERGFQVHAPGAPSPRPTARKRKK